MKKIFILIICLIITGCYNYQELNNYAIVTGIGIDFINQEYIVSALISNGNKEKDNNAYITVATGSGNTIYEAIKDLNLSVPKQLYISHLNVLILSKDVCTKGVIPILDFFIRDPQAHLNFFLVIAKEDKAQDILSVLDPIADFPSENIISNLKSASKLQGKVSNDKFNEFIDNLLSKGVNPVSTSLLIIGDEKKATSSEEQNKIKLNNYIKIDNLGLFKEDKLVGFANDQESIGINIINNNINEIYIPIACKNNKIIITTNNIKTKNKINKNMVTIKIRINATISEVGCDINLNSKNIKEIEKKVEKQINNYINKAIDISKEYKTDIFGYGNLLYKTNPKYFNNIKDWDEYLSNLQFKKDIKVKIISRGSSNNTLGEIKK